VSQRGVFVSFEGGEGAGKTTQTERLLRRIEASGREALLIREPGGTPLGEELRQVLLHRRADVSPEAELLLFLAARAELVRSVLRPALDAGNVVVCDRFSDSTLAYQGHGRGLDIAAIESMGRWATGGLAPDLTFFLDVPVEVGLTRKRADDDAFAREDRAFHERVRAGYQAIAAANPARVVTLDATLAPDVIEAAVWEKVGLLVS
jgi:dTMP kinase